MRIAFASTMSGFAWGGSEELWAAAARLAVARGHDALACVRHWPNQAPAVHDLASRGVLLAHTPRRREKGLQQLVSTLRNPWIRPLERFAPDVICFSHGSAYEMASDKSLNRLLKCASRGSTPYGIICQLNSDVLDLDGTKQELVREYFASAAFVAFVAERNRIAAERHLCMRLPRSCVLRNPVNMASTEVLPWPGNNSDHLRLACVARLHVRYKAQDMLLEALGHPMWKSRQWTLTLYGAGPDEDYLRRLVAMHGHEGRVVFGGHQADVRGIWMSNHALVLSSREEGTPLAMVEAMLCGRVPIVTDVGGCAEWVTDRETGFVAAAPTTSAILSALEEAWRARGRLQAMGALARSAALERFDPQPGETLLRRLEAAARQ